MHRLIFALPLILAACVREPMPEVTSGETFTKSRVVIIKGRMGGGDNTPPYLQEQSYKVTCSPTHAGGSAAKRAEALFQALPKAVGQVEIPIGRQYMRSGDQRAINKFAVPNYGCSVGPYSERVVSGDMKFIMDWAIKNKALAELAAEK